MFNEIGTRIVAINKANGWDVTTPDDWGGKDINKVPAKLALIHSEVSEALEGFRRGSFANFSEEMADVLIRVIDCAHGLGIDLDREVEAKLAKNMTRGYRHGGKRV